MVWDPRLYATLKFVHVLIAAAWIGAGLLTQFALGPLIDRWTPATRREVIGTFAPRMLRYGNLLGGFTLLSGVVLLIPTLENRALTWGGFSDDPWGRFIAFGLIMNLLALYLINFSTRPTLRVIGKLEQEIGPDQPPPPNLVFLQKRMTFTARLILFITLLALAAMVVANALYG